MKFIDTKEPELKKLRLKVEKLERDNNHLGLVIGQRDEHVKSLQADIEALKSNAVASKEIRRLRRINEGLINTIDSTISTTPEEREYNAACRQENEDLTVECGRLSLELRFSVQKEQYWRAKCQAQEQHDQRLKLLALEAKELPGHAELFLDLWAGSAK